MKKIILLILSILILSVSLVGCNNQAIENKDGTTVFEENPAPINTIETANGGQDIKILSYGFKGCPWCDRLEEVLTAKGLDYYQDDITDDESKEDEVYNKYYGFFDREDIDQFYYPTTIISTVIDGDLYEYPVFSFTEAEWEQVLEELNAGTLFDQAMVNGELPQ